MGSSKARKPTPTPEVAATATLESMQDATKQDLAQKKKRKFKLEDTLSIFDVDSGPNKGDLA